MANAKKCDICGTFYAAHKLSKKLRGYDMVDTATITLYNPDPNAEYPGDIDPREINQILEACPECMENIMEFISAMKENKT